MSTTSNVAEPVGREEGSPVASRCSGGWLRGVRDEGFQPTGRPCRDPTHSTVRNPPRRFQQDEGVAGYARAVGALVAAMSEVVAELDLAPSQRLVKIIKLDRN